MNSSRDDSLSLDALLDGEHPRKLEAAAWARNDAAGRLATFDRDRWHLAAEFGVLGLRTPSQFGGSGESTVATLLTFEGLGLGSRDAGFIFALASQVFAMQTALIEAGSDAQKAEWLPRLCAGDAIGCFAMSEPGAGSDVASISTTASLLDDNRFRLDGEKAWVTLGPVADVVIVFATTDPSLGRWGITAFLVPVGTPGLQVGPVETKSGLQSCPFSRITFAECIVDGAAMLGKQGSGAAVFGSAVEAERGVSLRGTARSHGADDRPLHREGRRALTVRQADRIISGCVASDRGDETPPRGRPDARLQSGRVRTTGARR